MILRYYLMSYIISPLGFTYPWIMTWFTYNFENFQVSLRIFDFILCNYLKDIKDIEIYIGFALIIIIIKNIRKENNNKNIDLLYLIYNYNINFVYYEDLNYIFNKAKKYYDKINKHK